MAQAPKPAVAVFAGYQFDRAEHSMASAEAWVIHQHRVPWAWLPTVALAMDGTAKVGLGAALVAGDGPGAFLFVDGRAYALGETAAGGSSGAGYEAGAGLNAGHVLLRYAYGWETADNNPPGAAPSLKPGERTFRGRSWGFSVLLRFYP
jgi:hypothetical protein